MALRHSSNLLRPLLRIPRRSATTTTTTTDKTSHGAATPTTSLTPRKGPILPPHNDPAAYHPQEHSAGKSTMPLFKYLLSCQ